MRDFRTFQISVEFYHRVRDLKLPRHLKDQLLRAASSISLNLMEGRGKPTRCDQLRYFHIAMGSTRECQAVFALTRPDEEITRLLDLLAASLYRLIERAR